MKQKELIAQLKQLKGLEVGGRPQEAWVARNREVLMSQVNPVASENTDKYLLGEKIYYFRYFTQAFRQAFRPVVTAAGLIIVFLGYTAMSSVASASLPGDMLYPIKTTGEKVQLSLTFDDDKKVELKMNFVSRRADEMQQLAKKPDSSQDKAEKISQTAKQISEGVNDIKQDLGKMASSPSPESVKVAKQVDEKTLKVEQDMVNVHASLPAEVKKGVANEIKEAISKTEDAGTDALAVMAKTAATQGDQSGVTNKEVVDRLSERIRNTESTIVVAAKEISKVTSTVAVMAVSSSTQSTTVAVISTTTIAEIANKPQQAQQVIEQAKDLLEKKDIASAIEKLKESKDIVTEAIAKTPTIDINAVKLDNSTTTTIKAVSGTASTTVKVPVK